MNEFDFIHRYLKPLAQSPHALQLEDDAAVLPEGAKRETVITVDALVEGRHFLAQTEPQQLARKILAVNLSDLAAMGATPEGYFLTIMFPHTPEENWLEAFAGGLQAMQTRYGFSLLGGDTVRTDGPLAFSVTMLGRVQRGNALRRSAAQPGERVYMTGALGKGYAGLQAARSGDVGEVVDYHLTPVPRMQVGAGLCQAGAHAAIDISDGLLADASHIAKASGLAMEIDFDALPICEAIRVLSLEEQLQAVCSGDDYELLFTAPETASGALAALADVTGVPISCIGRCVDGSEVVLRREGKIITPRNAGFAHF